MKMNIDFTKGDGLVPVIIQDAISDQVLMLGYMNEEALRLTQQTGRVTFYSRSKESIWVKGETSGNFLHLKEILSDCDRDTLLIKESPVGPTCHTGSWTCFEDERPKGFIYQLQETIIDRVEGDDAKSYTRSLFNKGVNKIAQKVGEEAVELVIEAKDDNISLFKGEAADLLYHYLILLKYKGLRLEDIEEVLQARAKK